MSPFDPGPCPSPTAAAAQAGFANAQLMSQLFAGQSDQLYGEIAAKVLAWITQALETQVAAQSAMAAKIAQPIATGLAQQAAGISQIGGAITSSIQAGLAGLQAPGGTVQSGVKPGQYLFSVFSGRSPTGFRAPQIVNQQQAGNLASDQEWCFQGSWQEWYDALAFINDPGNQLHAGACPLPGGPAGPPTPPSGGGVCPTGYQVWQLTGPPGTASDCQILCAGASPPGPGYVPYGAVQDLSGAQALVATLCGPPPPPPTGGGPEYYGGCVAGAAVTWAVGTPAPAGVSGQVGPFPDQQSALAAVASCLPPPTPTSCVCVMPPPTQGTSPTCFVVDLCDWSKFTNALAEGIYKGLCKWTGDEECCRKPLALMICDALCLWVKSDTCKCFFQGSDKYIIEDCQNEIGGPAQAWAGEVAGVALNNNVDDIIAQAGQLATALAASVADTGPNPWR